VIAIPIPNIPNAKNPGTIFKIVAPQELERYNEHLLAALSTAYVQVDPDAFVLLAVSETCVAIGPISETPTRIATKPPINLFIIVN
jgi:hypothetical protein